MLEHMATETMMGRVVTHNSPARVSKQKGQAKVRTVLGEFKRGKLRSSSGAKVTNRKQAIAIALSEAGLSRKR